MRVIGKTESQTLLVEMTKEELPATVIRWVSSQVEPTEGMAEQYLLFLERHVSDARILRRLTWALGLFHNGWNKKAFHAAAFCVDGRYHPELWARAVVDGQKTQELLSIRNFGVGSLGTLIESLAPVVKEMEERIPLLAPASDAGKRSSEPLSSTLTPPLAKPGWYWFRGTLKKPWQKRGAHRTGVAFIYGQKIEFAGRAFAPDCFSGEWWGPITPPWVEAKSTAAAPMARIPLEVTSTKGK